MDNILANLLAAQMLGPAALFLALVVATFVLEDVATVAAGLLAGRMVIDPATAVTALVVGTVVGDLALYAVGRWLGTTRLAARLRARGSGGVSGGVEAQLRRRGLVAVAAARFIPGTRLPVFFGSGVIALPFVAFTTTIVITTLIWTPALFFASSQAGGSVFAVLTPATLALASGLLALVIFAPRLVIQSRTAHAVAA